VGPDGAGHFVKMVHNGIEYADMQLIAEAYDLLRAGLGATPAEIADIFRTWNEGDLDSFLIQITAQVLAHTDPETGKPFVDIVLDQAEQKGTGRWTVQNALDLGIPVGGIAEAVFARAVSSKPNQREAVQSVVTARPEVQKVDASFADDVSKALYASKVVAYAQGFDAIIACAEKYGWNINKDKIAKIWRGGCIIRAQFLNRIADAYDENPDIATLLEAPYFADAVAEGEAAWRRVVATAALSGVPVPGFGSALSYYDSLASKRLPAALVQGQRDFFGAHTYQRVDEDGVFHTLWSGDRSEIQTEGSSH
jgi:6-phosphogluconate dehydrogenase